MEAKGIHELLLSNAANVCIDERAYMWGSIHLSGGCVRSPGFAKRLKRVCVCIVVLSLLTWCRMQELNAQLNCSNLPVAGILGFLPSEETAWVGGSIFASLSTSKEAYISRVVRHD